MTHNYNYDCREIGFYPNCVDCAGGSYEGHGVTACCRCGEPGGYGVCDNGSLFYAVCYDIDVTFVRGSCYLYGYCNGNKSDKRLKKKIKHSRTLENGIKLYTFEFKESFIKKTIAIYNEDLSGVWEGVIAQDLIGTKFDIYVGVDFDGYYQVDYDGLGIKLNKIND